MKQEEELNLPVWVWIIVAVVTIFNILTRSIFGLFIIAIGMIVGTKCVNWAKEIKANIIIAFFIGFMLGLIGLLGYYIYYNKKKKSKNI